MAISNIGFETPLYTVENIEAVRKKGAKVEAILTRPFSVTFNWNGERWRLRLPEKYPAAPSVPPFLRSFAPATGGLRWASFPHDWVREFNAMPLKDGDDLLIAIMKASGDGWFKRMRVWTAVRAHAQFQKTVEPTFKGMERIGKV